MIFPTTAPDDPHMPDAITERSMTVDGVEFALPVKELHRLPWPLRLLFRYLGSGSVTT